MGINDGVLEHNAEAMSLGYTPLMTILQGSQNYNDDIKFNILRKWFKKQLEV